MILTSLTQSDIELIKNLCTKFKYKYPNTYHEVEDLEGECYLKYDYIKNQFNNKKSSWEGFLRACLWNDLGRICLSTSSPISLKKSTCKKLLTSQSPLLSRTELRESIQCRNHEYVFENLDFDEAELAIINNVSFKKKENSLLKKENKQTIQKLERKLKDPAKN